MLRVAWFSVLVCGWAVPAIASPRADPTTGRAVFTGATMPTATSIDLNPAAIGTGLIDEVYAAAIAVLDRYSIALDQLDIASETRSPGSRIAATELGAGGTIAIVKHLSDRLTAGIKFETTPRERLIHDREALAYHTLGGSDRAYTLGVAGSLRATNELYFGVGLSTATTILHLRYARDVALERGRGAAGIDSDCGGATCGVGNPLAAERYELNVRSPYLSTSNFIVNLGIAFALAKDVWIGISYHAPPGLEVQSTLTGSMAVRQAPRDGELVLRGAATVFVSQPASADAELRASLRNTLDLHVGVRWIDLSRFRQYDVRAYASTFRNAGVPEWMPRARGLHDPLAVWAGLEQRNLGSWWYRLGGRVGMETSSVDDSRTSPLTIAPRSYTADLGVQFRLGSFVVQTSYGLQYFPTVSVSTSSFDPRSRLECIESGFDYSTAACESVRNGYAIATAPGTYDRMQHAIRIGLIYELP
jgi:hypothetical protein